MYLRILNNFEYKLILNKLNEGIILKNVLD